MPFKNLKAGAGWSRISDSQLAGRRRSGADDQASQQRLLEPIARISNSYKEARLLTAYPSASEIALSNLAA